MYDTYHPNVLRDTQSNEGVCYCSLSTGDPESDPISYSLIRDREPTAVWGTAFREGHTPTCLSTVTETKVRVKSAIA